MRKRLRWNYLARSPKLLCNILLKGRHDFTFDLMDMSAARMSLTKRANLLKAGMNLLCRKARPWSWPIHMQVELTNVCNLQCPVCPTGKDALGRSGRMMDLDLYRRLMAEVGPRLLTVFLWGWGEPLLHPRFGQAVEIARSHGVLPIISTNGQNLNDPVVLEQLIEQPPEYLIVAIDGLTDVTNSVYRVGASLGPVLDGVARLAEAKRRRNQRLPLLHMRYMAMKHNQHELPGVVDFATRHHFDLLTLRTLSTVNLPDSAHGQMVPDLEPLRAYRYDEKGIVRRDDFICQHAFCFPTVLADGTVVACDQDFTGAKSYGRLVADTSFADIWFGTDSADVRKVISRHRDSIDFCRNCPYADRPTNTCSVMATKLHPQAAGPLAGGSK